MAYCRSNDFWQLKSLKILIKKYTIYLQNVHSVQVMRDPTYEDSRYIEKHETSNDFNLKENITLVGPDYNSLCFLAIIANMRESPMDLYDALI